MTSFLPITTPEAVGIPSMAINAFLNHIAQGGIELHSLMILRHGKVCAEGWWKPYQPQELHNIHSFTKTFVATAIGMLADEGRVSIDTPILEIFPEEAPVNPSENLKKMTIRHLLTMSTGHHENPDIRNEKDSVKAFLAAPVEHEPGSWFCYNSSGSHILSRIVHKITGQNFIEYLQERLFKPMGFGPIAYSLMADGFPGGGGCMALRTEDMARLAHLYLNLGEWNGQQLISPDWIRAATVPQCDNSNGYYTERNEDWEAGYGYQLWMNAPKHTYRFDGAWGQEAVVCPDQDMAIICTAATNKLKELFRYIWCYLVNPVCDAPLPDNPLAYKQLQDRLENLVLPETIDHGTSWMQLEADRQRISMEHGTVYPIAHSLFGEMLPGTDVVLQSITPIFNEESVVLQMETSGGRYALTAGMSGVPCENLLFNQKVYASAHWMDQNRLSVTWRTLQAVQALEIEITYHLDQAVIRTRNLLTGEAMDEGTGIYR